MEFFRASELSFDPRQQLGKIFAEGFYDHGLKFISKDMAKLSKAMEHIFLLEHFYVAVQDETIMAMVGCTKKKPPPVELERKILTRALGFLRGNFAYIALKHALVNHKYPFELADDTASIEFVATAEEHRGKGSAKKLLAYVMEVLPYEKYVLEVIDTNAAAIKLYEKLRFTEFMRAKAPKGAGFGFFVYMRKD